MHINHHNHHYDHKSYVLNTGHISHLGPLIELQGGHGRRVVLLKFIWKGEPEVNQSFSFGFAAKKQIHNIPKPSCNAQV